jgi:pyridoxine 4-dehydrogenase
MEVVEKHRVEGRIKLIGVCNVTPVELEACMGVCTISVVQGKFSIYERASKSKENRGIAEVMDMCRKHRIPYAAYGVFGGTHFRQGKKPPLARSFPAAAAIAKGKGVSLHALVLAYLKLMYPQLLHIPGGRSVARYVDSVTAMAVRLSAREMEALDDAFARAAK